MQRSPARLPKTRGAREHPSLTPSKLEMLELLVRYRYLTPGLLARAYGARQARGGKGLSYVRHQLANLLRRGYVRRFYHATRPSGHGSDQRVYTVSPEGAAFVLEPETMEKHRYAIYNRAKHKVNYGHHLALSTLQLIFDLGEGRTWTVEDFLADHEPGTRLQVKVRGEGSTTLYPDATLVLGFSGGRRARYHFELDLARKNLTRIRERFRAYAAFHAAQSPAEDEQLFTVFVAPNRVERKRVLEEANRTLGETDDPPFLFWNMERWYADGALRRPHEILAEGQVADLSGTSRRIVPA